jgi:hypothetical protein
MKKLECLEQKIMLAGRISLVLLGLIFLVFAIWWAALSLPDGWKAMHAGRTESSAQKMQGYVPDAKGFDKAVIESQASNSGEDADTLALRAAMQTPEIAAHYDNIIHTIRGFIDSKPKDRKRIEAAAEENGDTLLAPPEFEAVNKYSTLCGSDSPDPATAAAAATVNTDPHCGKSTIRGLIADSVNSVLIGEKDTDKLALHKSFIAGLDQSISAYLDGKTPRDSLFALPAAKIATTLVSAFQTQFQTKLNDSPDEMESLKKLADGVTPLGLLTNPFVIGTVLFLVIFVNLMMMLAVMRIGRRLDQGPM